MQSKIHDKDAITILFILEMTSAARASGDRPSTKIKVRTCSY